MENRIRCRVRRMVRRHSGTPKALSSTVFVLAAFFLLTGGDARAQGSVATDRAALVALYNATDGPNWHNNTNWLSEEPLSEWWGVTVGNGRVTRLHLSRNQLTGSIPVELGNLSSLQELYLSRNQLTGSIPVELGNLSSLEHLVLTDNRLTGSIPAELGNLSSLQLLNLTRNQLTGSIPVELGNLSSLEDVNLSVNQLTGSIPAELGNLSSLRFLRLYGNRLTESIPAELGNLSVLRRLWLYENQLTGSIPVELGNLSSLERLLLHENQLTGSIPAELGNLSSLERLFLHENQLTGSIPAELGNLSSLEELDLTVNRLTGSIPAELGNLSSLERLFLRLNQLTGSIPAELGDLSSLEWLVLRGNRLTGSIPAELGNLSSLEWLGLDDNQLTGTLPESFTGLGALEHLYFNLNPGLCAQDSGAVRNWLDGVTDVRGPDCSPTVLLSVTPSRLWEGSGAVPVTVTAERTAVGSDTTVELLVGGSAEPDQDYTLSGNLGLFIPANMSSGTTLLTITPLIDSLAENDENIILAATVDHKTEGQAILPLVDGARACAALARTALEAFYNATGGPTWANNTNWLSNRPLAEWHGVSVDSNGCVVELDLSDNQLTGSIPAELGNLWTLQELVLSDNQLTGSIPAELGNLSFLQELWLDDNQLTGSIPAELGNLSILRRLGLNDNQLTGSIPAELGNLSSLEWLVLDYNQLTGSIPSELGNLSSLQRLYLDNNQLTGTLPGSFIGLGALELLRFRLNPGLCAQDDPAIRTWLNGVADVQGPDCPAAQSDETAKGFHFLPHIADGDGWQSTLLVTNVATSASQCTLQLYGLNADRFENADTVEVSGSTATFNLPGEGAYLTWPTRNQMPLASGYATLDCTGAVVAQVVFASIGSSGTPTGMATVFSSQAGRVFQFPVLTPEATLGFAIANDTAADAVCRIVLEDPHRTNLGAEAFLVPSKTNRAGRLLDQLMTIPPTFRGGTATVSCDQPVAMIGLHFELQSDRSIITFNTLPPAVLNSTQSSELAALEFLYRVNGGPRWTKRTNWLTDARLRERHQVRIGLDGRAARLPVELPGLGGRRNGSSSRGGRGCPGAQGPQPDKGGLPVLGPVRASPPAHG